MLYSNEDFENFYVRYKAEGLPRNMIVKAFCIHNKVPWNLFDKWYRDTRHRIAPVTVTGRPEEKDTGDCEAVCTEENLKRESEAYLENQSGETAGKELVRIMVELRLSNGMQIRQRNIDYGRLRLPVEKEGGDSHCAVGPFPGHDRYGKGEASGLYVRPERQAE